MPAPIPVGRRLRTIAQWPIGITLTAWRYTWRTTPITRIDVEGDPEADRPPLIPDDASREELQPARDGAGPMFHRRFRIRIADPALSAEAVVAAVKADLNSVCPSEFARFTKVGGEEGTLELDDEYIVHMPGPWNGPVRVAAVDERSFSLITLEGHLEAGQIRFTAEDTDDGELRFTIESWARSGDRLLDLLYDRLRFAKEVQLHMWTSFLEGVERVSEGRRRGPIEIRTHRIPTEQAVAVTADVT